VVWRVVVERREEKGWIWMLTEILTEGVVLLWRVIDGPLSVDIWCSCVAFLGVVSGNRFAYKKVLVL